MDSEGNRDDRFGLERAAARRRVRPLGSTLRPCCGKEWANHIGQRQLEWNPGCTPKQSSSSKPLLILKKVELDAPKANEVLVTHSARGIRHVGCPRLLWDLPLPRPIMLRMKSRSSYRKPSFGSPLRDRWTVSPSRSNPYQKPLGVRLLSVYRYGFDAP